MERLERDPPRNRPPPANSGFFKLLTRKRRIAANGSEGNTGKHATLPATSDSLSALRLHPHPQSIAGPAACDTQSAKGDEQCQKGKGTKHRHTWGGDNNNRMPLTVAC